MALRCENNLPSNHTVEQLTVNARQSRYLDKPMPVFQGEHERHGGKWT
jgi:hypothetical protein